MSKLPRNLSGARVIKSLKRLGFEYMRTRGSHIRMRKSNLIVTVPNHDSIHPKTLQSICKQASINIDQLIENL